MVSAGSREPCALALPRSPEGAALLTQPRRGVETSAARSDATLGHRQRKRRVLKGRSCHPSSVLRAGRSWSFVSPDSGRLPRVGFVFPPFGSPENRPFRTHEFFRTIPRVPASRGRSTPAPWATFGTGRPFRAPGRPPSLTHRADGLASRFRLMAPARTVPSDRERDGLLLSRPRRRKSLAFFSLGTGALEPSRLAADRRLARKASSSMRQSPRSGRGQSFSQSSSLWWCWQDRVSFVHWPFPGALKGRPS